MLYAGRFIIGMAGGAFAVAAPCYTSEIAEKQIRGALGSYFQLMVTLGILFVYAVGAGVDLKVLSYICGVIPIVFAVTFFFMPESPVFLMSKVIFNFFNQLTFNLLIVCLTKHEIFYYRIEKKMLENHYNSSGVNTTTLTLKLMKFERQSKKQEEKNYHSSKGLAQKQQN